MRDGARAATQAAWQVPSSGPIAFERLASIMPTPGSASLDVEPFFCLFFYYLAFKLIYRSFNQTVCRFAMRILAGFLNSWAFIAGRVDQSMVCPRNRVNH